MIDIKKLSYAYSSDVQVLNQIQIQIPMNQFLVIVGPNGSGKSTLAKILAGFIKIPSKSVFINNQDITQLTSKDKAKLIAYVPQIYHVNSTVNVRDCVGFGRYSYIKKFKGYSSYDQAVINHSLEQLNLIQIQHKNLNEISGGELQRTYLASALAQESDIILLDEPDTFLDPKNKIIFLKLLKKLQADLNKTIIFISHNISFASQCADQLIALKEGMSYQWDAQVCSKKEFFEQIFDIPFESYENSHQKTVLLPKWNQHEI